MWDSNKDDEGVNNLRTYRRLLDIRSFAGAFDERVYAVLIVCKTTVGWGEVSMSRGYNL